eukprot:COSAG01_NODE_11389_length_1946_cov_13.726650_3_plen_168_part_01
MAALALCAVLQLLVGEGPPAARCRELQLADEEARQACGRLLTEHACINLVSPATGARGVCGWGGNVTGCALKAAAAAAASASSSACDDAWLVCWLRGLVCVVGAYHVWVVHALTLEDHSLLARSNSECGDTQLHTTRSTTHARRERERDRASWPPSATPEMIGIPCCG